ncbi:DNA (cytosine-5)-methyltransferase 1 [Thermosporothrix hazakensis]|jgi:transcriptional regulator with XRE-family HTH domain|uniref:DNA (Cytosine-5)-methyltransferase 1 n=1 Tax=Thermosporothrix hazakensis TaxID=644383 RepID=A0A326U906_THEHA|nr:helix-turn-helix transcriptional regulator [Thermosporothrix hazakensis]PZW28356.1 DNA (cytosine-5)-methyltransferase 1 [Thermosporothrix hazakensis]GCE46283.1 hypothetical protein KTH_11520 [Thermosporothrix hazakensis]
MNKEEIRALRQERGQTQAKFAEELGVSPRTVMRWENGESRPRSYALQKLARLRMSVLAEKEADGETLVRLLRQFPWVRERAWRR